MKVSLASMSWSGLWFSFSLSSIDSIFSCALHLLFPPLPPFTSFSSAFPNPISLLNLWSTHSGGGIGLPYLLSPRSRFATFRGVEWVSGLSTLFLRYLHDAYLRCERVKEIVCRSLFRGVCFLVFISDMLRLFFPFHVYFSFSTSLFPFHIGCPSPVFPFSHWATPRLFFISDNLR